VGYWGHMIATRGRQDQEHIAALDAFGEHQRTIAENHHGWLVSQVYGGEPDLASAVAAVAAQTQAPAVGAYIVDSDCAIVEAATPGGARWSAALNPERAAEYGAPTATPEAATTAAGTWAQAAQLPHDDDLIRHVLTSEETFAEDQFLALLSAIPAATGEADPA
jgi:hypothetical protein